MAITPSASATVVRGDALPWVVGRRYDLMYFTGSIVAGLLFALLAMAYPKAGDVGSAVIYLVLGLSHFGSTWFFYLDDKNREIFGTRPWMYFYVPALLVLLPMAITFAGYAPLVVVITYWFSGWHVLRQSTGIANLYRGTLKVRDLRDRQIDDHAIMAVSGFCLVARYWSRTDLGYEAVIFHTPAGHAAIAAFGVLAALTVLRWAWATIGRVRAHGVRTVPLVAFTLGSFALFTPFVFVDRFTHAFMASLFGHYCQYLAIVWVINGRKYTEGTVPVYGSRFLAGASQNIGMRATVLLAYGIAVSFGDKLLPLIGLTWAHFFVDRFMFRFSNPQIRAAMLPFLFPPAPAAEAANRPASAA